MGKRRRPGARRSMEWMRLAEAWWLLAIAYLRRKDLEEIARVAVEAESMEHKPDSPALEASLREVEAEGRRYVNLAARYLLPWATCLPQSLALVWWMERRGIESTLRLGVRKEGAALTAHAWVERDGRVINDRRAVPQDFPALRPLQEEQAPMGRLGEKS